MKSDEGAIPDLGESSRDQVLAYGVGYGMGSVVSPELSFSFLDCDSFLAQIE